jgi:alpha-glucosidase
MPERIEKGYKLLGAVESYQREGRNLLLNCQGGAKLSLAVLAPGVVRIRFAPEGNFLPRRSWSVAGADEEWPESGFDLSEETAALVITTAKLKIQIKRDPCRLTILDLAGQVLCDEDERGGAGVDPEGIISCFKVMPPDEYYFGFGERTSLLNKRGRRYNNWTRDPWYTNFDHGPGTDNMYQAIPFFMAMQASRGGYGLYLNNTYHSTFDMDLLREGIYGIEVKGGELDYYFIYGPDPGTILERYTEITGRAPLPPRWSLGFQQCRWSYYPDSVVMELAKEFRERQIPVDTIVLDIDYMNGYRVFTWDRERFPDPKELGQELARQGFKLINIVDPGVKHDPGNYPVFDEGVQKDYFIHKPDGEIFTGYVWPDLSVFPDFLRAEVRQWWGDLHKALLETGVRGVWNDMNEPAIASIPFSEGGTPTTIPLDSPQGEPEERTTHAEAHNLFGYMMSRATYEGLVRLRPAERPFVLTRSGFAGIQKYAAVWMGDNVALWEHLEMSMPQLCNMGLSGVPFVGVDIGGFSFGSSAELFARWIELGAFYPFSRAHSASGTAQKEPWVFGPEVEAITRKYLELRYRLLPFIYTLFRENSQNGAPVFRPLFYHFWQDQATFDINDQVMIGESLMLAPVYRPGVQFRAVYLPEGVWYDWWSSARYDGTQGQMILQQTPLDLLPIYVRGGCILPLGPIMQYTDEKPLDRLTLEIFPDRDGTAGGQLYEDDGLSFSYQQGQFCLNDYECRPAETPGKVLVTARREGRFSPPARSVEIRYHAADGSVKTAEIASDTGNWQIEI